MKKNLFTIGALFLGSLAFGQTTILQETFEGTGLPAGWSRTQNTPSVGWVFGNNLGSTYWVVPSHTKYAASNDDANDDNTTNANVADLDRLISPSMDFSSVGSTIFLKLDAFYHGQYGSDAFIQVSTNGGANWTTVKTLAADDTGWQDGLLVNLSSYAGQSNVMVCLWHDDNGNWADGFAVDNFHVYTPAPVDMEMTDLTFAQNVVGPSNLTITGTVTNLGSSTITSLDIDWNDGTSHNETFAVNIAPLGTYNFSHGTALSVAAGTNYNLDVTVTAASDVDATNDQLSTTVYGLTFLPTTKVVGEEGTGTWCGWCPRGAVFMEQMANDYPNTWIGVAVHNGDPMVVTAYDNAIGALISGYPSGVVDRIPEFDPSQFPAVYADRVTVVRPAGVTVSNTWNPTTRALGVTVTANFAATLTGINWRLGAIVVEDDVTGTSSQYNQNNYYAGGGNGVMGGFESLPSTVPAAQMVYDHVGRALLGGFNGQASTVPTSITAGGSATYTFSYTAPATQDETQFKVIGVIIDQTTGEIINADEANAVLGVTEANDAFEFSLYPNPADDIASIKLNIKEEGDVTIDIYNVAGTLVNSNNYGSLNGMQNFQLNSANYEAGVYFVNVKVNGSVLSKKMIITH